MEIIPAIDLRDGKCVRLIRGDYDRETVFSDDPAAMARHWESLGATRLHVVDLDGARYGTPRNLASAGQIAAAVDLPVQMGGGIREEQTALRALGLGADRVVIGTAALRLVSVRSAEALASLTGPPHGSARDQSSGSGLTPDADAPEALASQATMVYDDLYRLIRNRLAHVGILGPVSLCSVRARAFTNAGFHCSALSQKTDPDSVDYLARDLVAMGRLSVTSRQSDLCASNVLVWCARQHRAAPTESALREGSVRSLARVLRRGQLVLASVSGSSKAATKRLNRLRDLLKRESGLTAGRDFWLARLPEVHGSGAPKAQRRSSWHRFLGSDHRSVELAAAVYTQLAEALPDRDLQDAWRGSLAERAFPRINVRNALVASIDARHGMVAVEGWRRPTGVTALDMARKLVEMGIRVIVYTDIGRDGTESGPNIEAVRAMVDAVEAPIIAAGGVASADDIRALRDAGAAAAIIGMALYTGKLKLEDALKAAG